MKQLFMLTFMIFIAVIFAESSESNLITTVEDLIHHAEQGGELHLAAMTFELTETLELSGDVRLIGQGYEETRIVSSAGEYVVRYTGGGTFAAEGIGFEYIGSQKNTVVSIDNGRLDITSCQFTGGKRINNSRGNGLWIKGNTRGTVRNSIFNANDLHGIEVYDNAEPQLESNRVHDNTESGIVYAGSAKGTATNNEIFGNDLHGIGVQDNAQPQLESNNVHDNAQDGISYFDLAKGAAINNRSYNNGLSGIYIATTANPSLQNNTTYDNDDGDVVDER